MSARRASLLLEKLDFDLKSKDSTSSFDALNSTKIVFLEDPLLLLTIALISLAYFTATCGSSDDHNDFVVIINKGIRKELLYPFSVLDFWILLL